MPLSRTIILIPFSISDHYVVLFLVESPHYILYPFLYHSLLHHTPYYTHSHELLPLPTVSDHYTVLFLVESPHFSGLLGGICVCGGGGSTGNDHTCRR